MQNDYFRELTINLRREQFAMRPSENDLLPVEWNGQPLCRITANGGVRYQQEDISGEDRSGALNRAAAIAKTTIEYMRLMESAPHLTASGLEGDYRLLADFNGTVLAGHPTKYGVQFITWERVPESSSLTYGHYYGPGSGIDGCIAAKRDFATRSGLIPHSALFTPEQLMEIYYCCTEILAGLYPIKDDQQKCLQSIIEQVELSVPDLDEHLQKELEPEASESPEAGGMQLC